MKRRTPPLLSRSHWALQIRQSTWAADGGLWRGADQSGREAARARLEQGSSAALRRGVAARAGKRRGSGLQRERCEVRADVVVVLVLGALEERDDAISQRGGDEFPSALEQILREHDLHEMCIRHAPVE